MSFSHFFLNMNQNSDNEFYRSYYTFLSQASNSQQLNDRYQILINRLPREENQYKTHLALLNKAHKELFENVIAPNQWRADYLKKCRMCLVSQSELFEAFKSTENLRPTVTANELLFSLNGIHYTKQIDERLLNITGRPTDIKTAINLYSLPQDLIVYYHEKINNSHNTEQAIKHQKFDTETRISLLAHLEIELKIFYNKYQANISNYLYDLLINNIPSNIEILKATTISRSDLEELYQRINIPSTILANKPEITQKIREKINTLPVINDEPDHEVKVTRISRNKFRGT